MSGEKYQKPGIENDYLNAEEENSSRVSVIYPIITVYNVVAIVNLGAIVNVVGIAAAHVGVVGSSCKEE